MTEPQRSVFISYRREASAAYARLLFDRLTERGYDVFFDYTSLPAGRYEEIIFSQIGARAHFVLLLARGTLARCREANDLLRGEIECALRLRRTIIPIFIDGFDFKDNRNHRNLIDGLTQLPQFQGVPLHDLSNRFLTATIDMLQDYLDHAPPVKIIPATPEDQAAAKNAIELTIEAPSPTLKQLSAEDYFNRAYDGAEQGDLDGAITDYTEAIHLDPEFIEAYNNRGVARRQQGDLKGAISDYGQAIDHNPSEATAYFNRGVAYVEQDNFASAIADFDEAIRLEPTSAQIYLSRGIARRRLGDLDGAIRDYSKAIELKPKYAYAYNNRALAYLFKNELLKAKVDADKAVNLASENDSVQISRGAIQLASRNYRAAEQDFNHVAQDSPKRSYAQAGVAICQWYMGDKDNAISLWRELAQEDKHFLDADWVGRMLNLRLDLIEETRILIESL